MYEAVCDCTGSWYSLVTAMKSVTLKPPMGVWVLHLQIYRIRLAGIQYFSLLSTQVPFTCLLGVSESVLLPWSTTVHMPSIKHEVNNSGLPTCQHMRKVIELYGIPQGIRRKPEEKPPSCLHSYVIYLWANPFSDPGWRCWLVACHALAARLSLCRHLPYPATLSLAQMMG